MTIHERSIDWEKVEAMTLALMYLTTFTEGHGETRSWKGHSFEVLNRLHDRGWLGKPVGKVKSVVLSEEGARRSKELFERHFVGPPIL